ncbi:MAG: hypothetical protein C0497_03075 [Gemmatimonas sp.]|nr:hypothetical protein [Gemmatimonas sp.]
MTASIAAPAASAATSGYLPTSGTAALGGAMGKDAFMRLLITQMTNQNPLNPQDGTQMASQLAQFSALEQMTNMNATLRDQAAANAALAGAVNNASAMTLLGREVTVASDQIAGGATGTTSVAAEIGTGGGNLTVRIVDANGATLTTKLVGRVGSGRTDVAIGDLTSKLPAGTYQVVFDLAAGTAGVTHPTPLVTATVDGVRFGPNGVDITSGSLSFPIGSIVSVR